MTRISVAASSATAPRRVARILDVDERAGRRRDALAVDGERRAPGEDEVELLVAAGPRAELVVLADDLLARLGRPPGVDPERLDPEHGADHVPARAALVGVAVDLVEPHAR